MRYGKVVRTQASIKGSSSVKTSPPAAAAEAATFLAQISFRFINKQHK